jgi:hypothetical protein
LQYRGAISGKRELFYYKNRKNIDDMFKKYSS